MRVVVALIEKPTKARRVVLTNKPFLFERFAETPEVRVGSPVRIDGHHGPPIGVLLRSWVDQAGTLIAEGAIFERNESFVRSALAQSKAGSIEFRSAPGGFMADWADWDESEPIAWTHARGSYIDGVALAVDTPSRSDTRVLTIIEEPRPAPRPAPLQVRSAPLGIPYNSPFGPIEYSHFAGARVLGVS